jgi:hypothetical protein
LQTHTHIPPQDSFTWGFTDVISDDAVLERVKAFRASHEAVDVAPDPYRLRGTIVVRFVSATAWEKSKEDMIRYPSKYLFLDTSGPSKPVVNVLF